ncbi:NAD-dependent epimerase/dehydratase family protein [bacterium]|nr:NAD-dependent epimerase/dehydratase family protein [candidate division CSSED10-310 bacterium]
MRILITGGAGFIGSHVADAYLKQGHQVAVVDNLSTGCKENLNKNVSFYQFSVQSSSLEDVFSNFRPDIVNHHAAHIDLRRSVIDPIMDAENNIIGMLNLLTLSVKYGVKKILFASTGGAIYGEPVQLPVSETAEARPVSPYGIHKLTSEHYLRTWRYLHDLDFTVLRYPNVYGPRQDPKGEAGVVAIFSIQMLTGCQPVIFGDGSKTRDYLFVSDIVKANILALEKGSGEIFNLGFGKEISDAQVFKTVRNAVKIEIEPSLERVRPGEVYRISLNADKAKNILGWKPEISFDRGVEQTVSYYREHLARYQS